jgi:hypothetical protein
VEGKKILEILKNDLSKRLEKEDIWEGKNTQKSFKDRPLKDHFPRLSNRGRFLKVMKIEYRN